MKYGSYTIILHMHVLESFDNYIEHQDLYHPKRHTPSLRILQVGPYKLQPSQAEPSTCSMLQPSAHHPVIMNSSCSSDPAGSGCNSHILASSRSTTLLLPHRAHLLATLTDVDANVEEQNNQYSDARYPSCCLGYYRIKEPEVQTSD